MKRPGWLKKWQDTIDLFSREIFGLYLAFRDRRTPWAAKVLALAVLVYVLSPIDLIPDFTPQRGYGDDMMIWPIGFLAVYMMMPREVMAESQTRAAEMQAAGAPQFRWMGLVLVLVFLVSLAFIAPLVFSFLPR